MRVSLFSFLRSNRINRSVVAWQTREKGDEAIRERLPELKVKKSLESDSQLFEGGYYEWRTGHESIEGNV